MWWQMQCKKDWVHGLLKPKISWTSSLPFGDHGGKKQQPDVGTTFDAQQLEEIFLAEQTIHGSTTTDGIISLPAIVSMEQFSR
jgi:hypothetical protein